MNSSKLKNMGKGSQEKSISGGASAAVASTKLQIEVILSPSTASCEGNSSICLLFDETPEALVSGNGRVEICVETDEEVDRIVATRINVRTFLFVAPSNRVGDASVVVFVNGAEVASCYLYYRSDTVHLVAGLSQIYLQFLGTVCRYMYTLQTKHQIPSPIPELDRLLAKSLEDKDNRIPPKAFEELFDIYRHSSTDVVQSTFELPTLLHLTGEYGLEQLAVRLLDLPGATRAGDIFNHSGRMATELARNNGYLKLAKTISASTKMKKSRPSLGDVRNPSNIPGDGSQLNNLHSRPKPSEDGNYVLQDSANFSPAGEDNFTQQRQPCNTIASERPLKPPPTPCLKYVNSKRLVSGVSESQHELSALPPRSVKGPQAPPIPRRESRNSGLTST